MSISTKEKTEKLSFTLIGAGKLGSLISIEFVRKGFILNQIITRTLSKARQLADLTHCPIVSEFPVITGAPDFILVTVNDDAIPRLLEEIGPLNIPVFHCSGSTSIHVFPAAMPNNGVLYPLQSFSEERSLNFDEIPILIEASNDFCLTLLRQIAGLLSSKVIYANSKSRLKSHIAAVFASNFSYHFIALARDYLKKNKLPADLLNPLLQETLEKAIENTESNLQTGPAVREDYRIIQKHQDVLKNEPSLQKLYTFVSESIIQFKKMAEKD